MTIPEQIQQLLNLNQPIGLVAGEGQLPHIVVESAQQWGLPIKVYALDKDQYRYFSQRLGKDHVRQMPLGMLQKSYDMVQADGVKHVLFAGKVNKWLLLRQPKLDGRALGLLKKLALRSDDGVMLTLLKDIDEAGFEILPQDLFLKPLFLPKGLYSQHNPTEEQQRDIDLGLQTAKEIARLDIGQSAIVSNGMVIALEAIEGTDRAILRCKEWVKNKGGCLAKVEKPNQDKRFDIPTVGPRTVESMRKAGLNVLAIEADKTMVLDHAKVFDLVNKYKMVFVAQ